MCKRLFRSCSNIANGSCVSKEKVWVSMKGYAEPWVMVEERSEPCAKYKTGECAKTSNEGYDPQDQTECKACVTKNPNERLMREYGASRLKALVEQRQAEHAAKTPTTAPGGSPVMLDSLTKGPMPIAGPSTANYLTPAGVGGSTLEDTITDPSSRGGKSRGNPGTSSIDAGNLGGKTIIPGPDGGTIGVQSLNLGTNGHLPKENPTIKFGRRALSTGRRWQVR